MKHFSSHAALGTLGLIAAAVSVAPANAQVTQLAIYQSQYDTQMDANSVTPDNFAFDTRIFTDNLNDVATATVSGPSSNLPQSLSYTGYTTGEGYTFQYETGYLAPQADLTTANPNYPYGIYTVDYSGGSAGTGSVSLDYSQVAYSQSTPQFTSDTFNALQNIDISQPLTLDWNTFVTGSTATTSVIFLTIADTATNTAVFSDLFADPTTTSDTVPAFTLQPNTSYYVDLDFSNRIESTNGDNQFLSQGFDQRTDIDFTTAAPEPSELATMTLLSLGLGIMILRARKRAVP